MEIFNRSTLKGFFSKGRVPTEVHFSNLIDSTINKIDDGFAKTVDDGLKLAPGGESKKLISFFEDIKQKESSWDLSINPTETIKGISFTEKEGDSRFFISNGGNIGVGTITPSYKLDIDGTTGLKTRVGTYQSKSAVPADSEWHIVLDDLEGCNSFEIVAKAEGAKKRGKYAMAHAIAVNTHNSVSNKIRVTQAYYGWYWHRIKFRWKRSPNNKYRLEIRTVGHYGTDDKNNVIQIKYHISSLWDDRLD
jgi:hypothetical protein